MFHLCVPSAVTEGQYQSFIQPNSECAKTGSVMNNIVNDLYVVWRAVSGAAVLAFVVSAYLIVLMRFFAAFMVWGLVMIAVLASIGFTVYLWLATKL